MSTYGKIMPDGQPAGTNRNTFATEKIKDAEVECLTSRCSESLLACCEKHMTAALVAAQASGFAQGAEQQRESDAVCARPLACNFCEAAIRSNPLVQLPKEGE